MTDSAIAVAGVAASLAGLGLVLADVPETREAVVLSFPPDLQAAQVETALATVAGLPARARVDTSVEGHDGQLRFVVSSGPREVAALRSGLQGFAPGVRLESQAPETRASPLVQARVGWRGTHVLLRSDQRELAVAALLGVLRGAGNSEHVQLRVRFRPIVRPKAPRLRNRRDRDVVSRVLDPAPALPTDQLRQVRNQYGGPLLSAHIEVLIWAGNEARAHQLLHQVVAVLRTRSGVRGRFSFRSHRFQLPTRGTMLAPPELVPLLGWPLDGPAVPGVTYVRSPQLIPDRTIPARGGRRFGVSTWPGLERRALHQPVNGALSHTLILGPTGSGKSALLTSLFLDDIRTGRGALLLDMKGDTAQDLLRRIPEKRIGDVVVLDPADARPLPGLKTIGSGGPAELAADLWVGLFRNLFADSWGVRTERYLRLGIQTLALQSGAVITDLPRVFSDPAFRRRLLGGAAEPLLLSSWAAFDALTPGQQAEHLIAPLGKVQDLIGRRAVRAVLGQTRPKMTIARAIAERKIVLVRLAPALLGEATAQLLGGLALYEVYQAVMGRLALPTKRRIPFGVYIDEPAVMRFVPIPLDSLYELARGVGVGITTATQSASQLPDRIQEALLTNAATLVSFRTGHADATRISRELLGVTAEQVQHLARYEIVLRLGLDHGLVAPVATARTEAPIAPSVDAQRVRDTAARRYGIAAEATDAELRTRWQQRSGPNAPDATSSDEVPLGRRRRAS